MPDGKYKLLKSSVDDHVSHFGDSASKWLEDVAPQQHWSDATFKKNIEAKEVVEKRVIETDIMTMKSSEDDKKS